MSISSLSRFLSLSVRIQTHKFAALHFTTTSSAEKYYDTLQKNGSNLERNLSAIRAKLDSSCIFDVLHRCSADQSQLGLRFFIWAGIQSSYRHSSYMYKKACDLLNINRNPQVLFDVFEGFRADGCLVSVKTFKVVLNLCKESKLADEAMCVLKKMPEFNLRADTTAYNVVIRLFCEKGDMNVADKLMREMGLIDLYPDMITFIEMIKGFCNADRLEEACGLFKVMSGHGCSPNAVAYSALLDGVCRFGSMEKALILLEEMENEGGNCSPNVVTYTSVIQHFCEKGMTMDAMPILERMNTYGCVPNRVTVSTLIKGFCTEGNVDEAYKLIDKVVTGGSVSYGDCYNSLVVSLVRINKLEEAEKLFRKLLATGVKPDGLACSVVMRELCLEGRVLDGFCIYHEIEKIGCLSSIDSDIHSILLLGLCQQDRSSEAAKLVKLMLVKGVRLKAPYVDKIVELLKKFGEQELAKQFTTIGSI